MGRFAVPVLLVFVLLMGLAAWACIPTDQSVSIAILSRDGPRHVYVFALPFAGVAVGIAVGVAIAALATRRIRPADARAEKGSANPTDVGDLAVAAVVLAAATAAVMIVVGGVAQSQSGVRTGLMVFLGAGALFAAVRAAAHAGSTPDGVVSFESHWGGLGGGMGGWRVSPGLARIALALALAMAAVAVGVPQTPQAARKEDAKPEPKDTASHLSVTYSAPK